MPTRTLLKAVINANGLPGHVFIHRTVRPQRLSQHQSEVFIPSVSKHDPVLPNYISGG